MLARIRKALDEKDQGFTLVELIVVVIIIGVLAAVAIPVFLNQAANARDRADEATLTNARVAVSSAMSDGTVADQTDAGAPGAFDAWGWPQDLDGATLAVTDYDIAAGTYTITLTGGQSDKTCTTAEDENPVCA